MSGKFFCLASLVAASLGLGTVRGQGMMAGPVGAPPGAPSGADVGPNPAPEQPIPSRWMLYDRQPGCCGPTGRNGPIGYEVYLRSGVAFPVATGGLGGTLDNGWVIEGGARTLFFNPEADAAWVVDGNIGNVYNRVGDRKKPFQLLNVGPNQLFPVPNSNPTQFLGNMNPVVTGSDLNRTYVSIAFGREIYLWGSAERDGCNGNWRVGFDAGGRYGTEKLDLNETKHLQDTTGGLFLSLHSDLEVPYGQCIFQAGLRVEYAYIWSDILQEQNYADIQDLSVLLTVGLRF